MTPTIPKPPDGEILTEQQVLNALYAVKTIREYQTTLTTIKEYCSGQLPVYWNDLVVNNGILPIIESALVNDLPLAADELGE